MKYRSTSSLPSASLSIISSLVRKFSSRSTLTGSSRLTTFSGIAAWSWAYQPLNFSAAIWRSNSFSSWMPSPKRHGPSNTYSWYSVKKIGFTLRRISSCFLMAIVTILSPVLRHSLPCRADIEKSTARRSVNHGARITVFDEFYCASCIVSISSKRYAKSSAKRRAGSDVSMPYVLSIRSMRYFTLLRCIWSFSATMFARRSSMRYS